MSGNWNRNFFLLLCAGAFVRLWQINLLPPVSSQTNVSLRFLTAFLGIISIILFYRIVQKLFKNKAIALWSAFWMNFSPWHIAESRIISPMVGVNFLILLGIWCLVSDKKRIGWGILIGGILLFFRFSWMFQSISIVELHSFVINILKYLSPDFLFFFNDTFWWGGFKEVGILTPLAFFPLVCGIYSLFYFQKWVHKTILFWGFVLPLIIASASPTSPETQEFFLAIPIISFVVGLGTVFLYNFLNKKLLGRYVFLVFLIALSFEFLYTWHIYLTHYQVRVKNEIFYEKRIF